jgi:serine/threonine protein kinase
MAPEVLRGDNYGKPADIWSLGCVIHELCTLIFMWMNEVPIGLLSLTSSDYLTKFTSLIINEEYKFFKDLLPHILLKGNTISLIRPEEKD